MLLFSSLWALHHHHFHAPPYKIPKKAKAIQFYRKTWDLYTHTKSILMKFVFCVRPPEINKIISTFSPHTKCLSFFFVVRVHFFPHFSAMHWNWNTYFRSTHRTISLTTNSRGSEILFRLNTENLKQTKLQKMCKIHKHFSLRNSRCFVFTCI